MQIIDAMKQRQSTRAFLDRPISKATLETILEAARWAPSGVNMQPWRVAILMGESRQRLGNAMVDARKSGAESRPDYHYYPDEWIEPYKSRRKATGLALYRALGIAKEESERRIKAWNDNYHFFGAPVGLLVFVDRRLGQGSWIDIGMFIQNIMLAAMEHGLASCPQASLAEYPEIAREQLGIDDNWALTCGIALGYPDPDAPANSFRTPREELAAFTSWYE